MTSHSNACRPKLLMVAYACDPDAFMESRLGWHRAIEASKVFDTHVICEGDSGHQSKLQHLVSSTTNLTFHCVERTPNEKRWWDNPIRLYSMYHRWHRRAFDRASELHRQHNFAATHQVNFCGFREPGYLWKLPIPFIWGPLGGTQNFPFRFLSETSLFDGVYEVFRAILNTYHLRLSRRVVRATKAAQAILVANSTCRNHFQRALACRPTVQLETGLASIHGSPRAIRDQSQPLRILWAGRFKAWKGFPLLVKALASLPETTRFQVRVLGYGVCEARWKKLIERVGLTDRFEWVGWPSYQDSFEHYRWADVFSFTSLRDTSGTGLLESLSFGVPIIGLDHQGAADIMTSDCAIPISIRTPKQVSVDIAAAIRLLYANPGRLQQLSDGALRRADDFLWTTLGMEMQQIYQQVCPESQLQSEGRALDNHSAHKNAPIELDSKVPFDGLTSVKDFTDEVRTIRDVSH